MGFMNYTAARLYMEAQLLDARKRDELKRSLREANVGGSEESANLFSRVRNWVHETTAQLRTGQSEPAPC